MIEGINDSRTKGLRILGFMAFEFLTAP